MQLHQSGQRFPASSCRDLTDRSSAANVVFATGDRQFFEPSINAVFDESIGVGICLLKQPCPHTTKGTVDCVWSPGHTRAVPKQCSAWKPQHPGLRDLHRSLSQVDDAEALLAFGLGGGEDPSLMLEVHMP